MSRAFRRRGRAPTETGDVAELLQHLGDDRWLRAHANASALRDGLDGAEPGETAAVSILRSRALLAIGSLREQGSRGERLHAIVSRCDLGGEVHKAVAADLGLSRRQFYRDLAFARGLIDRDVRAGAARMRETSAAPELADDPRFKTAVVLSAGGHAKAAFDHFAPAVEGFDGFAAVWGHSVLATLLLDGGDPSSAEREVGIAAERCDAASLGSELVALARAKLHQQTGRAPQAMQALEEMAARLQSSVHAGTQLGLDTSSEALALLAFCCHERGDFAAAARFNARNPAALAPARVSPFARRYYLNVNAMLSCDARAGPGAAQQTCDAFYRFAVSNGFLDDVSAALLQLAGIARFERRLEDAQRLARESLAIQRTVGGDEAPILSMLTGIAIDCGSYRRAVALARETRERAAAGSHTWWGAQLHEAEALARSSQCARALQICRRAARECDQRDTRLAAWRRRIEATVLKALGHDDEAYRAAGVSLEMLGQDAPPFHRLKTLLVAAHARPNRSHRAEIRNLTAVLGWSDAQD